MAPPPLAGLASLLALIPLSLFHGGMIRLALADLRAEPISTADAFRVGRERMWPMAGLLLLTGLAVGVGLLLLVVPGVLLALAWAVVGPVLVEERRPILQTYGRSAELTRGSRLNLFGLALTLTVFGLIASLALALVSAPFPPALADGLIWPLGSAAWGVVMATVAAAVYDELARLQPRAAPAEFVGV
jgi:hypothetical protein